MKAWDQVSVSRALDRLGVPKDVPVMLHSSIGWLGRPQRGTIQGEIAAGILHHTDRTLLLPAFSYSFPQHEIFDPLIPAPGMGVMSDWAMGAGFQRSLDPIFSILGYGPLGSHLLSIDANRSFGPGSTFDRLAGSSAYLVWINQDAGATIVHQCEYELSVDYRFEKEFVGQTKVGGVLRQSSWTSYVRDLGDASTEAHFGRLTHDLHSTGLRETLPLGRGSISAMSLGSYFDFIRQRLQQAPKYLTAAGAA
jgi:aminoglycoside 3-N-acetyltransferase